MIQNAGELGDSRCPNAHDDNWTEMSGSICQHLAARNKEAVLRRALCCMSNSATSTSDSRLSAEENSQDRGGDWWCRGDIRVWKRFLYFLGL